jgi:hypothetical protein
MLITQQKDKNIVNLYLSPAFIVTGKTCKSSYMAALRHARELGGRNLKMVILRTLNILVLGQVLVYILP